MKLVTSALKEKRVKTSDLPEALQERIASLKELTDKYNEAVEEWQEEEIDEATEVHFEELENFIADNDKSIADAIIAFAEDGEEYEEEEWTPPPTPPAPAPAPAVAPVATEKPVEKPEKKKDGGLGWLIFGGIVLVATVGAVNILKKK